MTGIYLVLALSVAAPGSKETAKAIPKLEGEWLVETMEAPFEFPSAVTWRFSEGKVAVRGGKGIKPSDASIKVDFTKTPATINITIEQGAMSRTVYGIIEVQGDKLKLCWALEGEKRPGEFKAQLEQKIVLAKMARVKPEK